MRRVLPVTVVATVHAERLHAAAPAHTRLVWVPDEDHDTIMADRSGVVARETFAWFDRALAPLR